MTEEIKQIETQIVEIETAYENNEDTYEYQEKVVELANQLSQLIHFERKEETSELKKLLKRVQKLKEDLEIFDPNSELDHMFPNRYDDGFDEDSMSYESNFGD